MLELFTDLGIIAGGIVALGIIWQKGLRPLYHFLRKMEEVHDIILEFPEWKSTVDTGLSQLQHNGGRSVKDVVNATNRDVSAMKTDISELKVLVEGHLGDLEAHSRVA